MGGAKCSKGGVKFNCQTTACASNSSLESSSY